MNRPLKTIMAIVLLIIFSVSCTKPDEPNNGVNNSGQNDSIVDPNNDGGNNGNNDSDVRMTTYTPQSITITTAKCGGDAIVIQGLSLTEIGVCWSKEQNPTADQAHLSTTVWNEPFVCTITGLEPDTKYYVRAYALRGLEYYYGEERDFITLDYGYVDLGLPSGILWATCNVGAETPEDYGDYFAWGETQPKDTYMWRYYKYCNYVNDFSPTPLTKYCTDASCGYNGFTDDLTTLLPGDDAATTNWGSGWGTPTIEQWQELQYNTTQTWMTQNGVNGCLFVASNGNSIFLPAAGLRNDESGLHGSAGVCCYYWSKSLLIDHPKNAWDFPYFESGVSPEQLFYNARRSGLSVRPIKITK